MSDEPEEATMLWLVSVTMTSESNEAAMSWLVSGAMSGEAEFSPALKDA